jgi:hypothetical protein
VALKARTGFQSAVEGYAQFNADFEVQYGIHPLAPDDHDFVAPAAKCFVSSGVHNPRH